MEHIELVDTFHEIAHAVDLGQCTQDVLSSPKSLVAVDCLTPGGPLHLGSGLARGLQIARLQAEGIAYRFIVDDVTVEPPRGADDEWFDVWIDYVREAWSTCGADRDLMDFERLSTLIRQDGFGPLLGRVARAHTLQAVRAGIREPLQDHTRMSGLIRDTLRATALLHTEAVVCQIGADAWALGGFVREQAARSGAPVPAGVYHRLLPAFDGASGGRCPAHMSRARPGGVIWIHEDELSIRLKFKTWESCVVPDVRRAVAYADACILPSGPMRVAAGAGGEAMTLDQGWELELALTEKRVRAAEVVEAVRDAICARVKPLRRRFEGGRGEGLAAAVHRAI